MLSTTDFRKGLKLMIEGQPCIIIDFQHVKPGKGGAFVRTKWRNILTGNVNERNFRSGDKFDKPDLEEKTMQYLYVEGDNFYFMDTSTYEQTFITRAALGDATNFLKENIECSVLFFEGKVIGVDLPNTVELQNHPVQSRGEGRHGLRGHQAGHDGDRLHGERPALHQRGRRPQDRHAHRRVRRARGLTTGGVASGRAHLCTGRPPRAPGGAGGGGRRARGWTPWTPRS